MVNKVLGLCRGDGKGYVKIETDEAPESLVAQAVVNGTIRINCPIYRLGFPGEDALARERWGDVAESNVGVVAVPLLDDAESMKITVYRRDGHDAILAFPFGKLETKIKSRLAYKYQHDLASKMRDIDQRRLSGITCVYVTGIFPVEETEVSCRFTVRYPYDGMNETCDIDIYDGSGYPISAKPIVLESSQMTDPRDRTQRLQEIVYAVRLSDKPCTLCIQARPERHDANFTCITSPMFQGFFNGALDLTKHASYDEGYPVWFEKHRATYADVLNQRSIVSRWNDEEKPLLSIVTVLFKPPLEYLRALLDSVLAQSYENFEMILVNVSGDAPQITEELAKITDPRIRVVVAENKSIPENTNIGLKEAKGKYIAFVDHDDVIEPDTLYRYVCVIHQYPDVDLLYCDEDLLDNGTYRWPVFKPDYNPDLLYAYNYVTHMLMISRHVLDQVELSPADVSGAQDYDLTLKCVEKARSVHNVPYMLYHWRMHQNSTSTNPDSKPYAETAGKLALERHFERIGVTVKVHESELPFRYRNEYVSSTPKKVSIVIPTKDHSEMLAMCLESVLSKTDYANYDITLVENNSTEQETFAFYSDIQKKDSRVRVVIWPGTGFNYSAICNYGASQCDGEILLFLNNDTEVINGDWLSSMAGFFERPEVGVVGAKLLFHDDLVQHGGIWASMDHCGYFSELMSHRDGGYMESMRYPSNCAAVTGACQMIRRDLFERVGGLDESLAVVLNDVDLCLKAGQEGYLVVFDPQAQLYHNEHTSRGRDELDAGKELRAISEQAKFYAKWDPYLRRGKYISLNLNQYDGHYKIAW